MYVLPCNFCLDVCCRLSIRSAFSVVHLCCKCTCNLNVARVWLCVRTTSNIHKIFGICAQKSKRPCNFLRHDFYIFSVYLLDSCLNAAASVLNMQCALSIGSVYRTSHTDVNTQKKNGSQPASTRSKANVEDIHAFASVDNDNDDDEANRWFTMFIMTINSPLPVQHWLINILQRQNHK